MGNIIPVYDVARLGDTIQQYDEVAGAMQNNGLNTNNSQFNAALEKIVEKMFIREEA